MLFTFGYVQQKYTKYSQTASHSFKSFSTNRSTNDS